MKNQKTFRPIPGLSREAEEQQLAEIIGAAQRNLLKTERRIKDLSGELYDLMETYGPKDKEGLALLHNTQSQLRESKWDLVRCEKARKKPYFGRIDFRDPKMSQDESYYVGRVGISESGSEPLVIDWRAPVASVYYENTMGPCRYVIKSEGTYEIDLKRKRTYEIAEDRLKDFFDSDVVANDELLTKYLAKNKRAVLGEIIATIQQEQNAIIRTSPKTNLIVQGVAGSGKTTVAMHRISYILYNYEDKFRPEDFYIIGSNRILLNYITSVLPDLDVYGVSQMTMEQLFIRLLYEDWEPGVHRVSSIDKKNQSLYIKGSYEWFHDLEQFCRDYEDSVIPKEDVQIDDHDGSVLLLSQKTIQNYLDQNPRLSVQSKINMLNEMLRSKLENELSGKQVSYTSEEKKDLQRMCRWHFGKDPWKGSIFEVYQEFLKVQKEKEKGIPFTENIFDVYDLAALAYLYKRIKETDGIREASHVIIDEAQDFGMMAYASLVYCLRGCTYTIMGDVSQNIHFGYGLNDWSELQELILTGDYDSFGLLKKSYRNTVEISDFATEILRHGNFSIYPVEPISRHGNQVQVTECRDEISMTQKITEIIEIWQRSGYETIAVICRDEEEASGVSSRLGERIPLTDWDLETTEFGSGVMVLPVEYTKGLEFDAVLIYHPSVESYPAEDSHVKLLYVAATRALHELAVVHLGDLTDLIGKPVSGEKRMHSLENEVYKEARPYKKREITGREQELLDVQQGDKERALRGYLGPKPIVVQQRKKTETSLKEIMAQQRKMAETGPNAIMVQQRKMAETGLKAIVAQRRKTAETVPRAIVAQQGKTAETGPNAIMAHQSRKRGLTQNTVGTDRGARSTVGDRGTGKRLAAAAQQESAAALVNPSPYQFGAVPDNSQLRPIGHSRIDCSIRMIRKTKTYVDLISNYGILRLTPLEEEMIRVQFRKGGLREFESGYWNYTPETLVSWTAKEGKNLVEVATAGIVIRIDKKTGAVLFFNREGKLLLAEKAALPRQIGGTSDFQTWVYFDWPKQEKLFARGILADDLERMNQKARYISFGGRKLRMPLLISEYGYGIGVAAARTVMCCAIPMYGPYLYTDGERQIDYYFLYGGNREATMGLYKKLAF